VGDRFRAGVGQRQEHVGLELLWAVGALVVVLGGKEWGLDVDGRWSG